MIALALDEARALAARWAKWRDPDISPGWRAFANAIGAVDGPLGDDERESLFAWVRAAMKGTATNDRHHAAHGLARMLNLQLESAIALCEAAGWT